MSAAQDEANAFLASMDQSSTAAPFVAMAVLPGDNVTEQMVSQATDLRVGRGLMQQQQAIRATKAGELQYRRPNRFWVDGAQWRYIPCVNDYVVGMVISTHRDEYRVDIGSSAYASLPTLAFNGATKRNRPRLEVGALVYARVSLANKDLEPELTCAEADGRGRGWATGEAAFGELHGGTTVRCSVAYTRDLRRMDSALLTTLGQAIPFEIAVGYNGRVWVNAGAPARTILVCNAVKNADKLGSDAERVDMARVLLHASDREAR